MATEFDGYAFPVKYKEADYTRLAVGLFPKGIIWGAEKIGLVLAWWDSITAATEYQDTVDGPEVQDVLTGEAAGTSLLGMAMSVIGSEMARIEADAWDVLNESDPGVAEVSLSDWERVLALPDPGFPTGLSVADRQRAAHAKLFDASVTWTLQAYIDFSLSMGFVVTVEELPAEYSESVCGAAVCGFSRCTNSHYSANSDIVITVVSGDGDIDALKAAIQRNKPAHVIVTWVV